MSHAFAPLGLGSGGEGGYTQAHLYDISVGAALVRLVVLRVLEQHLVHVGGRILKQLIGAVEYDERDLAIAQHAQLVCFFHQAKLAFCESNLNL